MSRKLPLTLLLAFLVSLATAESTAKRIEVAAMDVFGSPALNEVTLKKDFGKQIDNWITLMLTGDPAGVAAHTKLLKEIKQRYQLGHADWTITQFFEPNRMALYFTLEVIETKDLGRRAPFISPAKTRYTDPDGLIKAWGMYSQEAMQLVQRGQLPPDTSACGAVHCPFGHKHPALKAYQTVFERGVKRNEAALIKILKDDERAEYRQAAAYLLAYIADRQKVVELMVSKTHDADPIVRNNVLRVLGDIAEFHQDLVVPLAPIKEALDFPTVSDRTKALFVLMHLALNRAEIREKLLEGMVPTLVRLMETKQPDQLRYAYLTLKKISGKNFSPEDMKSWQRWATANAQSRKIAKTR